MIRLVLWALLAAVLLTLVQARADENDGLPLVRVDLDPEQTTIGEAVSLRITVLVSTWFPKPPVWPSLDMANAIVRLPPDSSRSVSERIGSATWSGITRKYVVFPQVPGSLVIADKTITLTYADPETREPIVSEIPLPAITITATVPEGAQDLTPYLAGQSLTLEQEIEGKTEDLVPGDSIVRTVRARIDGMPAMFLPMLVDPAGISGLDHLAASPILKDETTEDAGTIGTRTENVTYVVETDGSYTLPEIAISWWDKKSGEVRTEILEEVSLKGSGGLLGSFPSSSEEAGSRTLPPLILGLMALFWLGLVWWMKPAVQGRLNRIKTRWLASERYAYQALQESVARDDLGEIDRHWQLWCTRSGQHRAMPETMSRLMATRYGTVASHGTPDLQDRKSLKAELRSLRSGALSHAKPLQGGLPRSLNP